MYERPDQLSPSQAAYKATYDAAIKQGKTALEAQRIAEGASSAPRQPDQQWVSATDQNGVRRYAWVTEGDPNPKFTNFVDTTGFDLNELRPSVTKPGGMTIGADGRPSEWRESSTSREWEPALVVDALRRKQITRAMVDQLILPSVTDPAVKQRLQQMLTNPF